jgi:hypothetical protein
VDELSTYRGQTVPYLFVEVPYLFVDRCPVGGFASIRAFDNSGVLKLLVRGKL